MYAIKREFHLMILISLAATVFTTRNVDIIKWDCSLKKDELSISRISSNLSHLMITTFLVLKTVTDREISIIEWNCRLMVYIREMRAYAIQPNVP